MNKIFLILVILLTFSCSSSDDSNPTDDPFVGKWFFGPEVYKLDNGQDYTYPLEECQDQGFYRFNSNGTAEIHVSFEDANGECVIMLSDNIETFTWEKQGNNQYHLFSIEIDGTESSRTETVIFINDNNMYWKDTFSNGIQINGQLCYERWSYFYK